MWRHQKRVVELQLPRLPARRTTELDTTAVVVHERIVLTFIDVSATIERTAVAAAIIAAAASAAAIVGLGKRV